MFGTMSMCSISTVAPRGGALPEMHSFGMGIGSEAKGDVKNKVRAPAKKHLT